jgi:tetratricopeptide (TPR) repeat protein
MMKQRARAFAVALVVSSTLFAARAGAADCSAPPKKVENMSEAVYKGVQEANELMGKNQMNEAIKKLQDLAETGSDYEKALVNYNLGMAYSSKNDYATATKAFAKALNFNALPQQQAEQLQYTLGQLYMFSNQQDEGIKTLQSYIANSCSAVPPEAHIFLASALAERKRYKEALPQIEQAIAKAKEPKESWLQTKLSIAYELKDYTTCAQTLVQLIGMVPDKPEYWRQLSSMFMEMKQDTSALAVLALAERQGFVEKPNEIRNLYSIYMMLELPFKAGMVIQGALDKNKLPSDETNLDSLANAWINARETNRAETTLKRLASMSEKGEYYFKLGAMYGDNERWKESKEALDKALQKGGIRRTGEAWMRVAVAEYSQHNIKGAQAALQKAAGYDESRKQASEWLQHLGAAEGASQVARAETGG